MWLLTSVFNRTFLIGFAVWLALFSALVWGVLGMPFAHLIKTYSYETARSLYGKNLEAGIFSAFLISTLVVLCGWFFLKKDEEATTVKSLGDDI